MHGHGAGDDALRALARELSAVLRTDDYVLRLGGEEFLLALSGASLADASAVIDHLRRAVQASVRPCGEPLTVSVGVAARLAGEPRDALLARADAALYRAKAEGRDRVVVA